MVEKEEQGVGIAGQPSLRGRAVGEQGEGDALVLPAQELGERPDPGHGSLPAVRRHVADPHRGRAVLQKDEVGARASGDGDEGLRAREGEHQRRHRQQQAEPEREPAGEGEAFADRRRPALRFAGVAPPARELPQPQQAQARRQHQQPQVQRILELKGGERGRGHGRSSCRVSRSLRRRNGAGSRQVGRAARGAAGDDLRATRAGE